MHCCSAAPKLISRKSNPAPQLSTAALKKKKGKKMNRNFRSKKHFFNGGEIIKKKNRTYISRAKVWHKGLTKCTERTINDVCLLTVQRAEVRRPQKCLERAGPAQGSKPQSHIRISGCQGKRGRLQNSEGNWAGSRLRSRGVSNEA